MTDEVMTVKELAEYLKINYQTAYRKAKKGEIPASKFGRSWRFQKSIIDRWLSEELAVRKIRTSQPSLF